MTPIQYALGFEEPSGPTPTVELVYAASVHLEKALNLLEEANTAELQTTAENLHKLVMQVRHLRYTGKPQLVPPPTYRVAEPKAAPYRAGTHTTVDRISEPGAWARELAMRPQGPFLNGPKTIPIPSPEFAGALYGEIDRQAAEIDRLRATLQKIANAIGHDETGRLDEWTEAAAFLRARSLAQEALA